MSSPPPSYPSLDEAIDQFVSGIIRSARTQETYALGLKIFRRFDFPAYSRSLGFANAVAWIAIVEGHHPVLTVSYGACKVSYTTHAINGLSDSDFICAAKIDRLATEHN